MVHGSPGSTMAPGHQGRKRPIRTLDRRNRRLRVQNVLQSGQAPPASWCPVPKAPGGVCVDDIALYSLLGARNQEREQAEDPVLSQVIRQLRVGEGWRQPRNADVRLWTRRRECLFLDEAEILYIKFRKGRKILKQLLVLESLVPEVLQLKHDEAGHMSAAKTKKLILREYYWLSIEEDMKR